jgi:hypothetical protein
MGKLAQMAVDYYDELPAELLTPQTQTYRAMALIRVGSVALARDDYQTADRSIGEARSLLEKLRAEGHVGEPVTLGLALAMFTPFAAWGPGGGPGADPADLQKAADLLQPVAAAPESSPQAKLIYADILNHLSHQQPKETAVETCEEARRILTTLGAKDLTNLSAASVYADTADSEARHALALGRMEDAARLEQEVYEIAEKVLAQRPGDFRSMRNRALAADLLGALADRRHDHAASAEFAAKAERAGEDYVRFNPSDMTAWNYWIRGKGQLANAWFEQGRVLDSVAMLRSAVALEEDGRRPSSLGPQLNWVWFRLAAFEARTGQREAMQASLLGAERAHAQFLALTPEASARRRVLEHQPAAWRARVQWLLGETAAALDAATGVIESLGRIEIAADDQVAEVARNNTLRFSLITAAAAAIRLGRMEQAETFSRRRVELPPDLNTDADPQDEKSRATVTLAHAVAGQGRGAEALALVQPILDGYRTEQKAGAGGTTFQRDLAYALYVSAIAQPGDVAGGSRRQAALAEAARAFDATSAEVKRLVDVRELESWIAGAQGT